MNYFSHELVSIASGVLAAVFLTTAPAFKTRSSILCAQLMAGCCFSIHYTMLGLTVAALVNVLGCLQILAALRVTEAASSKTIGYSLTILMIAAGLWFWQGPVSLLSVAAMALIAIGRMMTNQFWLRILILSGGLCWLAHDLLGQAWIAVVADIGSLTIGTIAIVLQTWRIKIELRNPNQFRLQT